MANGLNKIMNFLKLTDEDDEYDEDFYDDEYSYNDQKELEREAKREQRERRKEEKRAASSVRREESMYEEEEPVAMPKRNTVPFRPSSSGSKVVQMPTANSDMEVCIVRPANIGESQQVCGLLMNSHPVIVNLEGIDILEAQRIMDFISGCIYAVDGNMCQVSRYIFIFSPKGVDISGDYIKSLENDESYNIANFNREF